jgi:hypothetical protein
VSAKGGSLEISYESNVEVTTTSDCDWLKVNSTNTRAMSESILLVNVSENTTTIPRTGTITISSKDGTLSEMLTITQKGQNNASVEDFEEEQEEW